MRFVLALSIAWMVMACGGASSPPPPSIGPRREIPAEVLARKAIAYSGYRTGQSPDIGVFPSEDEIRADLRLLVRGGWGLIRLFDSGVHAQRVLSVIAADRMDIKVLLGVWIAGAPAQHDAANRAEIDRCVGLVETYGDIVVAVSVGNETLDDWSNVKVTPDQLVAYIRDVRARVPQPVTTDDSWLPFALGEDGATSYADVIRVVEVVDFLALHVYAFADAYWGSWEWKQESVPEAQRAAAMMDAAMAYSRESLRTVRDVLGEHGHELPILITEIGWKSATDATADSPPEDAIERWFSHPVNQRIFYDALMRWVYGDGRDPDSPDAAFTFEAFDEPWKGEWGDDGWGLFDVERRPKYVLWEAFPDLKPVDAPAFTDADAVFYRP